MSESVATTKQPTQKKPLFTAKNIARIAILTALSTVLYTYLKFPLPMLFPSFLDFQFSDFPALLGGFAMGPVAGAIITVLKTLLKLALVGTNTSFVGELADIIMGLAMVLPATILYTKRHTFKGALTGIIIGLFSSTVVAIIANRFILVPFYVELFFKSNWDGIVGMLKPLFPDITKENFYSFYLWIGVLPFNLIRLTVTSLATIFTYKPLSKLLHN